MRTNARTVMDEYRIERTDGHKVTCDRERCSLRPFYVLFSTSCVDFGTYKRESVRVYGSAATEFSFSTYQILICRSVKHKA